MKKTYLLTLSSLFILLTASPGTQASPFTIDLTIRGFSIEQAGLFARAKNFWETHIYERESDALTDALTINAYARNIDGEGSVLGRAAISTTTESQGFTYATAGNIVLDTSDIGTEASFVMYLTILHELAHIIGFGSLWIDNGLYVADSYQYTGVHALTAYRNEFNAPTATFVPVENDGGPGTAGAHWEKDVFGNDLLTGSLSAQGARLSRTSLRAFKDLGYVVSPAPSTILLLGMGLLSMVYVRRKEEEGRI